MTDRKIDMLHTLTMMTPDVVGTVPDSTLVTRKFQRVENGHVYHIERIVFILDSNMWGYEMYDVRAIIRIPIVVSHRELYSTDNRGVLMFREVY